LSARAHGWLFLEALLGNFLFSICMLYGVSLTSAVSTGIIMATIPAVVALLSHFFLRERLDARMLLAVACAVTGVALAQSATLSSQDSSASPHALLGNLLIFGAVLCEAAYTVIGKKLVHTLSARRISALVNLWGLVLMTPLGLTLVWRFDFSVPTVGAWLLLLYYALAASVWSVWLWMSGLKNIPAGQGGIFTVFLPLSTALVGVAVLGESLSGMQWIAFAVALLGVLLASLPSNLPRPQPAALAQDAPQSDKPSRMR
jgi:drug/metabolite transporter (DMT)-like permease